MFYKIFMALIDVVLTAASEVRINAKCLTMSRRALLFNLFNFGFAF